MYGEKWFWFLIRPYFRYWLFSGSDDVITKSQNLYFWVFKKKFFNVFSKEIWIDWCIVFFDWIISKKVMAWRKNALTSFRRKTSQFWVFEKIFLSFIFSVKRQIFWYNVYWNPLSIKREIGKNPINTLFWGIKKILFLTKTPLLFLKFCVE